MVDDELIEDVLLDKFALEAAKYENLQIQYSPSCFFDKLDDLVVKNLPGHFKQLNWSIFPSKDTLIDELTDQVFEIAVTPFGNADSPVGNQFAKPYLTNQSLQWLIEKLENPDGNKYYFQSQNDNLHRISCSAPKTLPLSENIKYLGEQQAANLWIGTKGTTSRLHSDNYDNIYVQVAGRKRIYLLPPCSIMEVDEIMLEPATYNEKMELIPDEGYSPPVLFPTYDPSKDTPKRNLWTVELGPGDVLFLPALWYHQVEIYGEGLSISLNYWHTPFDDERRWSSWNLCRQLAQLINV